MTQINLEEVKKQAVHDGILEAIVGVIFSDRADEAIGKALKLNM